jgi:hypothetical protein
MRFGPAKSGWFGRSAKITGCRLFVHEYRCMAAFAHRAERCDA